MTTPPLSKYDRLAMAERRLSSAESAIKRATSTFDPAVRLSAGPPTRPLVPFAEEALKHALEAQQKLQEAIQWIETLLTDAP